MSIEQGVSSDSTQRTGRPMNIIGLSSGGAAPADLSSHPKIATVAPRASHSRTCSIAAAVLPCGA
jgi:muramidase (phage lysozyme)